VLVELVIDGRHRAGAEALLERYAEPQTRLTFVSAAHGLIEAASALRRLVRQRVVAGADGAAALRWLGELDIVLDATAPRLPRIWALRDRMSAYDAAYAAAAEAIDVPLLTTDSRLLRACQHEGIPAEHIDAWISSSSPNESKATRYGRSSDTSDPPSPATRS
jgi:predicted nucleic acid-binding protein